MHWLKTKLGKVPRRTLVAAGVLLVVAFVAFVLLARQQESQPTTTIPISEFMNRVERREIRAVTIAGSFIHAVDTEGKRYRTVKEDQAAMADWLRRAGVSVSVRSASEEPNYGLLVAFLPIALIIVLIWLSLRRGGINSQAMQFGKSSATMLKPNQGKVTFDDVAGVSEAKQELREIVEFLKRPEKFRSLGARIPKGVLLVGPPGTGKTLISRAVAGEAGVAFFSISGSAFVEMFVGVGASRVRDLFRQAKKSAPCIIFIDEIDAVGRQRGSGFSGNDEREQTLNQLLVEMDGFDANTNIIVIAATNRPDVLDQALLRPGRFDRRVVLDPPDINGRKAILEVHTKGKPLAEDISLHDIARQTPGFSGADLANLVNEAAILAARDDREAIGRRDFDEGVLRVLAGPERKNRVITDYEKSVIAYHEVGHALVAKALRHAHPVTKVSIIARGQALGITMQTPKEDSYLISTAQLRARMAALLGGRVAEELVFGDVTTGAKQDLEMVTDIARRMVLEFGMSDLGIVPMNRHEHVPGSSLGEEMASRVDRAIKHLLDESYDLARAILRDRHHHLVGVSKHLIAVETIDGDELTELLGPEWTYFEALPSEPISARDVETLQQVDDIAQVALELRLSD